MKNHSDIYLQTINDKSLLKIMSCYFSAFEAHWTYISESENNEILNSDEKIFNYLKTCRNTVKDAYVEKHIKELKKFISENEVLNTTLESFLRAIHDFNTSSSTNAIDGLNAWIRVLCAYFNTTRMFVAIEKLNKFLNHNKGKLILAIGTINSIDKNEKYRQTDLALLSENKSEIDDIFAASTQKALYEESDYIVIPVLGCSFELYCKLMKTLDISILHCSGHGLDYCIQFGDEKINLEQFTSVISTKMEIVFLNCCQSYSFVCGKCLSNCDFTIVYDGNAISPFASEDGATFYFQLLDDMPRNYVFDYIEKTKHTYNLEKNASEGRYYVLHSKIS